MDMDLDISTSDYEDEEVVSAYCVRKPVHEDEDSMEEELSNEDDAVVSDYNPSQEEESPRPTTNSRSKSVETGSNVSLKVSEPNIELIPSPVFTSSVDVERIRSLSESVRCCCVWTQEEEMCGQYCTNRKERRECSVDTCREDCGNMVSTTTQCFVYVLR